MEYRHQVGYMQLDGFPKTTILSSFDWACQI